MGRIFGTDGVRDRAGHGWLSPANVRRIGRAVAGLLKEDASRFRRKLPARFRHLGQRGRSTATKGRVLVGRDTRASGPAIERALIEGLRAGGVGAIRAGVLTTPGVAILARDWGCALGAVISASHNPAGDNGIKFISPEGLKIPDTAEEALESLILDTAPRKARSGPKPMDRVGDTSDYLEFLARFCRPLKGLRVVVDCAHGAASAFAGPLLERVGAQPIVTCAAPNGRNINAGCGALHPERVARAVRRERADIGVAFDGDADRLILADERGTIRDGEHVLALTAEYLASRRKLPRRTVVSTVMANLGLERWLADRGITLKRTKVGDRYVAEELLSSGAVLGGEPSGHILFLDASPAGDGLLTMMRVLDIMACRETTLGALTKDLPRYPQTLLNVKIRRKPALEKVPPLIRAIGAAERALGKEGRILVRYSGTEPLCRVMVEGAHRTAVARAARRVATTVKEELA